MTQGFKTLVQNLPNGWTFSASPDLSGPGYSVAAYPTPGTPFARGTKAKLRTWFTFKDGQQEQRAMTFGAAVRWYLEVAEAESPDVT